MVAAGGQPETLMVPGNGRMVARLVVASVLHLGLWSAYWLRAGKLGLLSPLVVFGGVYALFIWRLATRRVVLGTDAMVVHGIGRSRIARSQIHGFVVETTGGMMGIVARVVGIDDTGLGRTICTVRGVPSATLREFCDPLNSWCGYDPVKAKAAAQAAEVNMWWGAARNLEAAHERGSSPSKPGTRPKSD